MPGYEEKQLLIEAATVALEARLPLKPHVAREAAEIAAEYMLDEDLSLEKVRLNHNQGELHGDFARLDQGSPRGGRAAGSG